MLVGPQGVSRPTVMYVRLTVRLYFFRYFTQRRDFLTFGTRKLIRERRADLEKSYCFRSPMFPYVP